MFLNYPTKTSSLQGTKLVFVEHVEANYRFANGLLYWLTFWARDVSSSLSPESKIYQAKVWRRGKEFKIPIFRLKPTDEGDFDLFSFSFLGCNPYWSLMLILYVYCDAEIDSVEVQPPSPMRYDFGIVSSSSLYLEI